VAKLVDAPDLGSGI